MRFELAISLRLIFCIRSKHYVSPPISNHKHWLGLVFALFQKFDLSAVIGITMGFQFGTNWPGFMNTVGNIAGPLLAYEVPPFS